MFKADDELLDKPKANTDTLDVARDAHLEGRDWHAVLISDGVPNEPMYGELTRYDLIELDWEIAAATRGRVAARQAKKPHLEHVSGRPIEIDVGKDDASPGVHPPPPTGATR